MSPDPLDHSVYPDMDEPPAVLSRWRGYPHIRDPRATAQDRFGNRNEGLRRPSAQVAAQKCTGRARDG